MKKLIAILMALPVCFAALISASAHWITDPDDKCYYEPSRPEGYNECIGDILALKMSLTDDPDYKYMVAIYYRGGFEVDGQEADVAGIINYVNRTYDAGIDVTELMRIVDIFHTDSLIKYYIGLTRDQINILTKFSDKIIKEMGENEFEKYGMRLRLFYVGTGGAYQTGLFHGKLEDLTEAQFCELRGDGFSLYHEGINAYLNHTFYYEVEPVFHKPEEPEATILLICMITAASAALLSLIAAVFSIMSYKRSGRRTD